MSRKLVHVGHDDRGGARRRGAADALAPRNTDTGGLPLKRAEHEVLPAREIKSRPVEVRQPVIDQRRHIGAIRDQIAFPLDQRRQLPRQIVIEVSLIAHRRSFRWLSEDKPPSRNAGEGAYPCLMTLSRRTFLLTAAIM